MKKSLRVLFAPVYRHNPYQNNLRKHLEPLGVEVLFIRKNKLLYFLHETVFHKFDLFHLHWTHPFILDNSWFGSVIKTILFYFGLVVLKVKGTSIIWTIHNLGEHEQRHPAWEKLAHKLLLKFCNRVIVHSDYCRTAAIEYWKDSDTSKYQIIPHGNYIENYTKHISKEDARKTLGLPQHKKIFLSFGQLRGYKGIENIVESFKVEEFEDSLLLIVGKPKDKEIRQKIMTQSQYHENIRLYLEYQPDEKIQYFMNASDIVLFSFKDIFTSGSVLLAMSFGKVIIAPALPALESLVKEGGIITYETSNPATFSQAASSLNTVIISDLGEINYQAALKFNWADIAKQTLKAYETVKVK